MMMNMNASEVMDYEGDLVGDLDEENLSLLSQYEGSQAETTDNDD
jgi:hypothetical protein